MIVPLGFSAYKFADRTVASPGFVYLARGAGSRSGLHKVGCTKAVRQRFVELARLSPIQPVWYVCTNQMGWLERYVMLEWKDLHVGNEWFRLGKWHVDWFRSFRSVTWKGLESADIDWDSALDNKNSNPKAKRVRLGVIVH